MELHHYFDLFELFINISFMKIKYTIKMWKDVLYNIDVLSLNKGIENKYKLNAVPNTLLNTVLDTSRKLYKT